MVFDTRYNMIWYQSFSHREKITTRFIRWGIRTEALGGTPQSNGPWEDCSVNEVWGELIIGENQGTEGKQLAKFQEDREVTNSRKLDLLRVGVPGDRERTSKMAAAWEGSLN